MDKDLIIKLKKCTILVSENDLIRSLSSIDGLLEKSIKKGKGYLRSKSTQDRELKRNAGNFDRWGVYELLKSNKKIDNNYISYIAGMDKQELLEGVIEYLLSNKNN